MTRGVMPSRLNEGHSSFNRVGIAPRVISISTAKGCVPPVVRLCLTRCSVVGQLSGTA